NEIKMGARLTVREAQKAIFVNKGQIADVFEPGMYTLETDNLPILSTLMGWKHGFHSPFKAEVYFVNMRRFTDLKWGTKHPITLRDAEFGPVRLRAFGTYVVRVSDPQVLLREIVGTDGHFTTGEITDQLRNLIVSRFADVLAESKIPVLDLAANYEELGQFVTERIKQEFTNYGLELTTMLVENISLPPTVEEALDKRTSMGAIGDLHKYTQFQAANAMEEAAKNPGGMAGGGMGMGMGFAMANQMGQAMADQGAAPPPLPQSGPFYAAFEGQQAGPFDLAAMRQHIESGRLTPQTLVWRKGMAGWVAAEHVKELKGLFDGPPPLP
ncbi:MAG: SPFH domain-containing protein, partial [Planctomycetes bacterium]|nr:SPFH domain-containing protein [Planctomycetota bacterium]